MNWKDFIYLSDLVQMANYGVLLSAGTIITKETKGPNNRVLLGTLLFGCVVCFVVCKLFMGNWEGTKFRKNINTKGTSHVHGKHWKFKWFPPFRFRKYGLWFEAIDAIFLQFLVCEADLDILRNGLLSQHVKFYNFMFMHKISTRVVCLNGEHRKSKFRAP